MKLKIDLSYACLESGEVYELDVSTVFVLLPSEVMTARSVSEL